MRAQKKKVPTLSPHKARQLFEMCVGEETVKAVGNFPEFNEFIKECGGLPLAIKTVANAMAPKRTHYEWKHEIDQLKSSPLKFPLLKEVFKPLMFSYDSLPENTRQCFFSCALYPEDYCTPREELVQLWIAEGLLHVKDGDDYLHRAHNCGKSILNSLIRACMLEAVTDFWGRDVNVKMHDLLRDMALWKMQDEGTSENSILVQQSFDPKKWEAAKKISIWSSEVRFTQQIQSLSCSNLRTLILRNANIEIIPSGFFSATTSLEVLDLKGNSKLKMLPDDIGELINLRSLDLSQTNIRSLTMEVQKLKKLRYLLLPHVHTRILKKLMPNFIYLRLFSWRCNEEDANDDEVAMVEVLQSLESLCEFSLALRNSECVKKLLTCPKLLKRVTSLHLMGLCFYEFWSSYTRSLPDSSFSSSSPTRIMEHLRSLTLQYFEAEAFAQFLPCSPNQVRLTGEGYFLHLKEVQVLGCDALVDITLLVYNAPRLESLDVQNCSSLREVISGQIEEEDAHKLFQHLTYLKLTNLPCLNSICRRALPFPAIKTIYITDCPNLRKLPLRDKAASTLSILGERNWWNELQWNDQPTKQVLEENEPFAPFYYFQTFADEDPSACEVM